jgi:hypothetical protein
MTPFDGIGRLLIDGNNLLHRMSGNVEPGSIRLLLAKLSGALPAEIATIVMLDGHAASGTDRHQRIRRGLEIHHAGSLSADDAMLNIVRDTAASDRAQTFVITDDRALSDKARHLGARTKRLEWLQAIVDGATARSATGIGRKGIRPPATGSGDDDETKQPWQPGRGATRKRGNPKREKRERQ